MPRNRLTKRKTIMLPLTTKNPHDPPAWSLATNRKTRISNRREPLNTYKGRMARTFIHKSHPGHITISTVASL